MALCKPDVAQSAAQSCAAQVVADEEAERLLAWADSLAQKLEVQREHAELAEPQPAELLRSGELPQTAGSEPQVWIVQVVQLSAEPRCSPALSVQEKSASQSAWLVSLPALLAVILGEQEEQVAMKGQPAVC